MRVQFPFITQDANVKSDNKKTTREKKGEEARRRGGKTANEGGSNKSVYKEAKEAEFSAKEVSKGKTK